jgi:putative ABC transport system permease protein
MKLLRMSLVTALRALRRNKMRSGLTILGIVIGVGAVITTVGIGQGAARAVQAEIQSLGKNLLVVVPGATTSRGASSGWGGAATLTVRDAEAILREASAVTQVTYVRMRPVQVVYAGSNWATQAQGTTRSYMDISELELAQGSFFSEQDEGSAARVVVIGQTIVSELFERGEDPVGAVLRIRDVPFRVVGVLRSKGQSSLGRDRDDILLMPFATAERRVIGSQIVGLVDQILVSSVSEEQTELARQQIEDILRDRHRLGMDEQLDFTVRSLQDVADVAKSTTAIMTSVLLAVASISLLVGGIGIMNILLVSVTERTREIGIRMSVGAKRRHILVQFLMESMMLSVVGGLLGMLLGFTATAVIAMVVGWPFVLSLYVVLGAVVFSAAVGMFFGFYPAQQASQLDPIASLRYE